MLQRTVRHQVQHTDPIVSGTLQSTTTPATVTQYQPPQPQPQQQPPPYQLHQT
jgi:hypothetical protein